MEIPVELKCKNPGLARWAIITAYRGSIAHGMYVPGTDPSSVDDKDVMAVCVPPLAYYYGLKEYGSHGTQELKSGEWDVVIYEARKYISLLAQGNPNVLMLLWLNPGFYHTVTGAGQILIDHRHLFVGRHAYRSFTGYAYSQLHRMTHNAFDGYMGAKRKALVQKHGYDCKNAAHLIRLLRMGSEFMRDGELYVERSDAAQLLEIKRGAWTLDQVKAEAERGFHIAEEAYLASTLPAGPDPERIGELAINVVAEGLDELRRWPKNDPDTESWL